jgi:hypothetical protein
MQASLDSIEAEFPTLDRRLAVFDREMRRRHGVWTHDEAVPVEVIISQFTTHGAFTDDGRVVLPLHGPDSPDPTGEYVVVLGDHVVPCVVYYDFGKGGLARIPLEEFGRTYPARRIRFWHPDRAAGTSPGAVAPDAGDGAAGAPIGEVDLGDVAPVTDDAAGNGDGPASTVAPTAGVGAGDAPDDGDAVVDELRAFLNRERAAERDEARRQFRTLGPERYADVAGGIPELVSAGIHVDDFGQQVVRLRVPGELVDGPVDLPDEFGIHPGSEVVVDVRGSDEWFPVEAEVLGVEGRQLDLGVYWNRLDTSPPESAFEHEGNERRFAVGELLNPVPYDREQAAIEALAEDDRKRGIVTGETTLGFEPSLDVPVNEHRLNKHQYRAAMHALRAEDVYCIHGPPGTGKTRTLVEIVRAAAGEGKRVLACAHSNQAIDNLLVGDSTDERTDRSSLHAFAREDEFTVARAGSNTGNELVEREYVGNDRYQSDVVCTTTNAAHRFGENIFDYAVVDEASQATIPATLVPMTRAKRTILAGDHRQLPPYHSAESHDDEQFEISLFEHVLDGYGEDVVTTLETQYRMNREIAAFPNERFYGGRLGHGSKNRNWTVAGLPPLKAYHVEGEEARTPGSSYYNDAEVAAVVEEVSGLVEAGIPPDSIGVIAPYSGQVGKIRGGLIDVVPDEGHGDVEVATVDSFQGSERDVVVISFVRSNPEGHSGFLTFPTEGPRRLNVALTRARKRGVLVGNFDTLRTRAPDRDPDESSHDCFQALYEFLRDRGVLVTDA